MGEGSDNLRAARAKCAPVRRFGDEWSRRWDEGPDRHNVSVRIPCVASRIHCIDIARRIGGDAMCVELRLSHSTSTTRQ